MRVAKHWPEIEQKRNGVADLSYRDAVKLLASPKETHQNPLDLPELSRRYKYTATNGNGLLEITPDAKHEGFFRVAYFRIQTSDLLYDSKGVRYTPELLGSSLLRQGFKPATPWQQEPWDGKDPWYVNAPGRVEKAFV